MECCLTREAFNCDRAFIFGVNFSIENSIFITVTHTVGFYCINMSTEQVQNPNMCTDLRSNKFCINWIKLNKFIDFTSKNFF